MAAISETVRELRASLTLELSTIKPGNQNTSRQWYYVDSENHLNVYDKPATTWEVFCEYITRLFARIGLCSNRYAKLEEKVTGLVKMIDTYLSQEKNTEWMSGFLSENTIAINALYSAMFKLKKRGRVKRAVMTCSMHERVFCSQGLARCLLKISNTSDKSLFFSMENFSKTENPAFRESHGSGFARFIKSKESVSLTRHSALGTFIKFNFEGEEIEKPVNCATTLYEVDVTKKSIKVIPQRAITSVRQFECVSSNPQKYKILYANGENIPSSEESPQWSLEIINKEEFSRPFKVEIFAEDSSVIFKPFNLFSEQSKKISFDSTVFQGEKYLEKIRQAGEFSCKVSSISYTSQLIEPTSLGSSVGDFPKDPQ